MNDLSLLTNRLTNVPLDHSISETNNVQEINNMSDIGVVEEKSCDKNDENSDANSQEFFGEFDLLNSHDDSSKSNLVPFEKDSETNNSLNSNFENVCSDKSNIDLKDNTSNINLPIYENLNTITNIEQQEHIDSECNKNDFKKQGELHNQANFLYIPVNNLPCSEELVCDAQEGEFNRLCSNDNDSDKINDKFSDLYLDKKTNLSNFVSLDKTNDVANDLHNRELTSDSHIVYNQNIQNERHLLTSISISKEKINSISISKEKINICDNISSEKSSLDSNIESSFQLVNNEIQDKVNSDFEKYSTSEKVNDNKSNLYNALGTQEDELVTLNENESSKTCVNSSVPEVEKYDFELSQINKYCSDESMSDHVASDENFSKLSNENSELAESISQDEMTEDSIYDSTKLIEHLENIPNSSCAEDNSASENCSVSLLLVQKPDSKLLSTQCNDESVSNYDTYVENYPELSEEKSNIEISFTKKCTPEENVKLDEGLSHGEATDIIYECEKTIDQKEDVLNTCFAEDNSTIENTKMEIDEVQDQHNESELETQISNCNMDNVNNCLLPETFDNLANQDSLNQTSSIMKESFTVSKEEFTIVQRDDIANNCFAEDNSAIKNAEMEIDEVQDHHNESELETRISNCNKDNINNRLLPDSLNQVGSITEGSFIDVNGDFTESKKEMRQEFTNHILRSRINVFEERVSQQGYESSEVTTKIDISASQNTIAIKDISPKKREDELHEEKNIANHKPFLDIDENYKNICHRIVEPLQNELEIKTNEYNTKDNLESKADVLHTTNENETVCANDLIDQKLMSYDIHQKTIGQFLESKENKMYADKLVAKDSGVESVDSSNTILQFEENECSEVKTRIDSCSNCKLVSSSDSIHKNLKHNSDESCINEMINEDGNILSSEVVTQEFENDKFNISKDSSVEKDEMLLPKRLHNENSDEVMEDLSDKNLTTAYNPCDLTLPSQAIGSNKNILQSNDCILKGEDINTNAESYSSEVKELDTSDILEISPTNRKEQHENDISSNILNSPEERFDIAGSSSLSTVKSDVGEISSSMSLDEQLDSTADSTFFEGFESDEISMRPSKLLINSHIYKYGIKQCRVDLGNSRVDENMLKASSEQLTKPNFCKLKRKLETMLQTAQKEENIAAKRLKMMRDEKSTMLLGILSAIKKVKRKYKL